MSRTRHRRPPVPEASRAVQHAYSQLVQALSRADAEAVQAHTKPDISQAVQVLTEHPDLNRYLYDIKAREDARRASQVTPDLALSSPTGSSPQAQPLAAYWSGSKNEPNVVVNARLLRELASTDPWVRAAINIRRLQVGRADIDVAPLNPMKPYSKKLQRKIRALLNQPNEYRDTYRSLMEPVLEDILVLDRGVLTKSMTPGRSRTPQALYYEDGATIGIIPGWDGDPAHYRYVYEEPGGVRKVPLRNDECIVFILNQASHRYGLSPVQVLLETIQSDLAAAKSGKRMVDMKPPPHMIHILNATDGQIRNLRSTYETEVAGQRELLFMGGPPVEVTALVQSAKDNQWLEWQQYLMQKIAAVFQISPQQLGMTFDINKSTGQTQQQIYEDTGFIPLLLLLEEQLNREFLSDFAPTLEDDRADLDALNLRIVYPEVSESARQLHAEKAIDLAVKGLAGLPSMTLNQVLAMRGEQPVPGGNTFYYPSPSLGPVPWLSYDGGDTGDYTPPDTGGAQGSQDPASGLLDEDDPEEASGKSNVPPPVPQQQPPATSASLAPAVRLDATPTHTGVMIAFYPDPASASALAVPGGEPAQDLHVTLAYLKGDDTSIDVPRLRFLLSAFAREQPQLSGTVSGVAQFQPTENSDWLIPVVALVNVKGIQAWHEKLVQRLRIEGFAPAENFEYTPHITLAYISPDAHSPVTGVAALPLFFDSVTLADGDTHYVYAISDRQYPVQQKAAYDRRSPGKRWLPSHMH